MVITNIKDGFDMKVFSKKAALEQQLAQIAKELVSQTIEERKQLALDKRVVQTSVKINGKYLCHSFW